MQKVLDLTGQKLGRLLILEKTNKRTKSRGVIWKCQCECGNIIEIGSPSLKNKLTQSCGCLRKEKAKEIGKKTHVKNFKDYHQDIFKFKTNIPCIQSKNLNKNNISGTTGVTWAKSHSKWRASIMFQNKNYFLGYFTNIKDATKVRKIAEKRLFGEFLEWYYENYPEKKKKDKEVK
jgi:hypothetical protein